MASRSKGWWIPIVCCAALVATGALGAETGEPELSDRVGTLALDAELDARGNLGGMTTDRLGFLYVANFRDAVWRISPEGEVETLTRSLYGASGNVVDSRGDLYQASFLGNTITRIARTGEVVRVVEDGLDGPVGLAVDETDRLYVANCRGNFLSRVDRSGQVTVFAESERFACPNGLAFADDGNLYVTNFNHVDLLRVRPEGEVSVFATVPGGAGNAHLTFSKGSFFVTKIMANRVMRVTMDGEVFPLAGTGEAGHGDGPAGEATLHRPNGIAMAPTGDRLYVNTLVGEYSRGKPSTVAIRTIDLLTVTKVLEGAREEGGVEAMAAAYERYRADPVRGREDVVAEMVTYGYSFLSSRKIGEALTVFELNAGDHPESAAAQYQLGEAYRYTGRAEEAKAQYRRTLELDPEHALAASRLAQLSESP